MRIFLFIFLSLISNTQKNKAKASTNSASKDTQTTFGFSFFTYIGNEKKSSQRCQALGPHPSLQKGGHWNTGAKCLQYEPWDPHGWGVSSGVHLNLYYFHLLVLSVTESTCSNLQLWLWMCMFLLYFLLAFALYTLRLSTFNLVTSSCWTVTPSS